MNNNIYNNNLRKEIVSKADIVSIIGSYVNLEKKGANYIGLCPFHDDKNPSMSVSPSKKVFKCFSCNTGGDVVTFVSKFKNISIRDAMREIGNDLGIKVNVTKKEIERQKNDKYYKMMQEASNFYSFFLNHADDAKAARDYLHNRGLNNDVIKEFNIGLSSDNDEIYKLLLSKEFLPVDMIEVGLVRSYSNSYKDVFRNRIIFPITDLDGNICGFSGRRYLENDHESKYLNTNETIIFKKGEILYNYSNAFREIKAKNKVYLFEGFMDVIASCRSGMKNSIASMGTNLTIHQIEAIKRITNDVVICYDSDEPGLEATLRAIELMIPYEFNVYAVLIPDTKDADEYIKAHGEQALYDVLNNNQMSAMDYIYNVYYKRTDFKNISSKEAFKNTLFRYLMNFKSSLIIDSILNRLSKDLGVNLEALVDDYNLFQTNNKKLSKPVNEVHDDINFEFEDKVKTKTKKQNDYQTLKYENAEKKLLYASFYDKIKCLEIDNKLNNCYVSAINRDIRFKLVNYYHNFEMMNIELLYKTQDFSQEEKQELENILNYQKTNNFEYVDDCIKYVLDYPSVLKIIKDSTNGEPKTLEDLGDILKTKQGISQIKSKRRRN